MNLCWFAIPIMFATGLVWGQDTPDNIRKGTLDLSVPDSPAFTVLGLTPQPITHPATPRELASSVLNGVDQNGNFQTGVAVDTAPYLLFYGKDVTFADYRNSRKTRVLSRTQFWFASTKGTTDSDKSARFAAGLKLTIFDKGDARLDPEFTKKLVDAAISVLPPSTEGAVSPKTGADDLARQQKEREDKVEAITKPIRKQYERTNWNRSSWRRTKLDKYRRNYLAFCIPRNITPQPVTYAAELAVPDAQFAWGLVERNVRCVKLVERGRRKSALYAVR